MPESASESDCSGLTWEDVGAGPTCRQGSVRLGTRAPASAPSPLGMYDAPAAPPTVVKRRTRRSPALAGAAMPARSVSKATPAYGFGGGLGSNVCVTLARTVSAPAAGASPQEDKKAELRKQAMADAGVQAMLEVFPVEIRDVEEI